MSHILFAIAILVIFVSLNDTHAQGVGTLAQARVPAGLTIADCEQLASLPNATKSAAVVRDGTALATRQAGEIGAFVAESYALGAGTSLLSAYTPNFVGAAIAAAWQARLLALAAKGQAEQAPANARMNQVMLANSSDLMRSMQAHPRFGRLMQLGLNKSCEPPAAGAE